MKLKSLISLSQIILAACLLLTAHAQTFTVIHKFSLTVDGSSPAAGLTMKGDAFYGPLTVGVGGSASAVYQLTEQGSTWTSTVLAPLSKGAGQVSSRVAFGPDGHLYGAARIGGTCSYKGYLYQLLPPLGICKTARCSWAEKDLHYFGCGSDGAYGQDGDLAFDQQGNIYGTTPEGGDWNLGTVFELEGSGNDWTEHVLYSFFGQPDGALPFGGVIFDKSGNLYGVAAQGGTMNSGTVFELSYDGVEWTEHSIYNFEIGEKPYAGLVQDASGNFYGATMGGGSGGGGTIFELSPVGNSWNYQVLYSFSGQNNCGPWAALTLDNSGNLYGTTFCNGANSLGNVFKLAKMGDAWVYSSLHDFTGQDDGAQPVSNVIIGADGTLYGTASNGGYPNCGNPPTGCGTAWMITP
jgi:uncharacterized repeat protein (TIGR03803 family)